MIPPTDRIRMDKSPSQPGHSTDWETGIGEGGTEPNQIDVADRCKTHQNQNNDRKGESGGESSGRAAELVFEDGAARVYHILGIITWAFCDVDGRV